MVYALFEEDGTDRWAGEPYDVRKDPREVFEVREQNRRTFMLLLKKMLKMEKECAVQNITSDNYNELNEEARKKLESFGYLVK